VSSGGSLTDAIVKVADGGTIVVDGTVAVTEALGSHGKTITITGGQLDFTGLTGDINLGDHITFDNITLNFADNAILHLKSYLSRASASCPITIHVCLLILLEWSILTNIL
jgi:hypothetical protein